MINRCPDLLLTRSLAPLGAQVDHTNNRTIEMRRPDAVNNAGVGERTTGPANKLCGVGTSGRRSRMWGRFSHAPLPSIVRCRFGDT